MQWLLLVSNVVTISAGTILGTVLLLRARRRWDLPTFAIGFGLFTFAVFARGLAVVAPAVGEHFAPEVQRAVLTGSTLGSGGGLVGPGLFT